MLIVMSTKQHFLRPFSTPFTVVNSHTTQTEYFSEHLTQQ